MTIRLANKKFTTPDGESRDGPMDCVVVGYVSRNTYYKNPYQQGQFNPPTCFAQGNNPKTLAPDPTKVTHPEADTCAECPHDQWGSGGAKRKACKNVRLLAVVPPNAEPNAPLLLVQVSPQALKRWDNYVVALSAKDKIPLSVVTRLDFDPTKLYPLLTFEELGDNPNEELHFTRMREAEALLNQAPMVAGDDEGSGNGNGKPSTVAAPPVRRGKKSN
jgi:hypothetical protein